jgi:hypothetical protein
MKVGFHSGGGVKVRKPETCSTEGFKVRPIATEGSGSL